MHVEMCIHVLLEVDPLAHITLKYLEFYPPTLKENVHSVLLFFIKINQKY